MNAWIAPGMLFVTVTIVLSMLFALLRVRFARPAPDAEPEPVFGALTPTFAAQVPPMSSEGLEELQRDLMQGGFYDALASENFRAVRYVLVIAPLIIGCGIALLLDRANMQRILIGTAFAAILGYALPRAFLSARMRYRARRIELGLPMAIDLLTLCLSAGQNLLNALDQVSRELRTSNPILAQELTIAYKHAQLHSLESAMKQWSARANSAEVTNLALILIQSEELGTDAAATLQEMSNNLRTTTRQRAEGQANKASFWMLLPTIFCFWIAAAIVLIGPPYMDFFQKNRTSTEAMIGQAHRNIDKANTQSKPPTPTPAPVQK
jgi:tight adherence protein C